MKLSNSLASFVLGLAVAVVAINLSPTAPNDDHSTPPLAPAPDDDAAAVNASAIQETAKPLRIICFGAHPDDCELRAAGVAAKWAERGHKVKFVSLTNGDIGHWRMAGGPLAQRRNEEVQRCAKILGITSQVLDIHDGELLPTLDNRRTVTRLIREWKADIVMSHRPNNYHPDHRNVGVLVQDAAFMVTVPYFCPDTPHLQRNPVFMYYEDRFQKPNPFAADVIVAIDSVIEKKIACTDALKSQFYEGGCCSGVTSLPQKAQAQIDRQRDLQRRFRRRFASTSKRFLPQLKNWYGEGSSKVTYSEAFELCEYGRRPSKDELRKLFPF